MNSTNEFKFAELPEINKEYASKADKIRTPFTGRPEELIQRAKEGKREYIKNIDESYYWIDCVYD